MKVVCLLGSPRADANSTVIARKLCAGLAAKQAEIEILPLRDLTFSGCRNLFYCKTKSDRCGLQDDFTPILEAVHKADVIVLATPVYFTDVSSDLKAAIERFFSFFTADYVTAKVKSRLPPGKRLVFIQTQGEDSSHYGDLLARYSASFEMLGIAETSLIRASSVREAGAVAQIPQVWDRVDTVIEALT